MMHKFMIVLTCDASEAKPCRKTVSWGTRKQKASASRRFRCFLLARFEFAQQIQLSATQPLSVFGNFLLRRKLLRAWGRMPHKPI